MRNIDVPGAQEIFAKQEELLNTFWQNRGYATAAVAIFEVVRKDYVMEKMRKLRASTSYERGARAFYEKFGTSGEF